MTIVLTDSLKKLLIETASQLKGAAKRKFMAQTVQGLGVATCNYKSPNLQSSLFSARIICNYNFI
ncbi:hypothetical protein FM036_36060 [Nostoc sp. HG1]|nr:hypothetical protein [Nostoc sp. HG1]